MPTPAPLAHVVLFAAPPDKRAPSDLRDAFAAVPAFRDSLPDVVSPVAALGLAVKPATTDTARFVHGGQAAGVSRWIYTRADVTMDHAHIQGETGIEVRPDGLLRVDPTIPLDVRAIVEDAYRVARGVVEPSRLNSALAAWMRGDRRAPATGAPALLGTYLRDGAYLMPHLDTDTAAILAAVVSLGGLAAAYPVQGAALASLAAPVQRTLEDEVAAVLRSADDVISKARAAAAPGGPVLQQTSGGDLAVGETAHTAIDDVRARLALWRDRLGLALGDVAARLTAAEAALNTACDAALAAAEARKAERKRARAAAGAAVTA